LYVVVCTSDTVYRNETCSEGVLNVRGKNSEMLTRWFNSNVVGMRRKTKQAVGSAPRLVEDLLSRDDLARSRNKVSHRSHAKLLAGA